MAIKIAVKKFINILPAFLTMLILVSIVLFHPNFCFAKTSFMLRNVVRDSPFA